MFVDFDDIIFWGSNIPKEVEIMMNSVNESVDISFDNDEQKRAYLLGGGKHLVCS